MQTLLTVLHVIVCVFLILVVLLQAGKGGGMGIAFGGAGSQTVFGSSGAGNFLTKLTTVTAAVFMITSLGLAHYSSVQDSHMLQEIAEKKAAQKRADEAKNAQTKTDIEKAREAIEKSTGLKVDTPNPSGVPAAAPSTAPGTPQAPAAGTDKGETEKKAVAEKPEGKKAAPPVEESAKAAPAARPKAEAPTAAPAVRKPKKAAEPKPEGAAPAAEPSPAPAAPPPGENQ